MDKELLGALATPAITGLAQLLALVDQDEEIPVRGLSAIVTLIAESAQAQPFQSDIRKGEAHD